MEELGHADARALEKLPLLASRLQPAAGLASPDPLQQLTPHWSEQQFTKSGDNLNLRKWRFAGAWLRSTLLSPK